jgi:crotonobetaine/carnitine-CoA ligase
VHKLALDDRRERLLGRCLRRQAEAIPERDFLVAGETHYSYGRVNELANAMASGFASLGVERGDTVAVMMESCPDYVWATLGLNKLGAIWVPTNTDYKGQWLRESLEDSRAKVLVVDEALLPRIAEAGGKLPFQHVVVRGNPGASPLAAPALAAPGWRRSPTKRWADHRGRWRHPRRPHLRGFLAPARHCPCRHGRP